jgi:hypothetical protein
MQPLTLLLALALPVAAPAADFAAFARAVHQVESGGRVGLIIGDQGRALGPLQIHRGYWQDARQPGEYQSVTNLAVATATMHAYLQRYAPAALAREDWQTCARIHNGGPRGASRTATLAYSRQVISVMR